MGGEETDVRGASRKREEGGGKEEWEEKSKREGLW